MNSVEKNNLSFYHDHYSNPQRSFEEYLLAYNMMKVINRTHCQKNILEVGYGSCLLVRMLSSLCKCNYYGYEKSSSAKKIFISLGNTINIDNIDTLDIKFDIIILSNVIEHIKDDFSTICKLFKLLTECGKLCITFPTDVYFDDDPRHFRTYNVNKFAEDIFLNLKNVNIKKRYLPPTFMLISIRLFFIKIGNFLINIISNNNSILENKVSNKKISSHFIEYLYFKIVVPVLKFVLNIDFILSKYVPTSQGYIEIIKVANK